MAANRFTLKGSGVEVDYTIGITPGLPALLYKEGAFQKSFTEAEITTEDTGLGQLVSVSLILSIDTGGKRFGFFLPFIDIARGQTATFHTIGIDEMFSGPDSVPHRPSRWRCFEMTGEAQSVIVPL
ncbi:hypothetical protein [Rhodopila globiformis]|uniref:Uncharacterized protein n=1 Tax=Rhodopila globiformis TaxID=1071 RepID=A0A2S6MWB0_RHOGL|nr:hypothetical protein [Rhodopila globiformis]PPQ26655.1 hypothetical protein CCS01_29535 [Rhodopila globiformis]